MSSLDTGTVTIGGIAPELAADLAQIAQARGRLLTLAEARELCDRAEAVRRAFGGAGAVAPDRDGLLPRSVRVGAVTLHQLTLGARLTLRRVLGWEEAQPGLFDPEALDAMQAYCFAHARDAAALGRLSSPEQAATAALEWAHQLTCSGEELAEGVRVLTAVEFPPATGGGPGDPAAILDSAMKRYGGEDTGPILYGMPEAALAHLLDGANANERASAAAVAKARGELPPASCDERADAVGEYAATRERITKAAPAPQEKTAMKRELVRLDDGGTCEVREMTWAELQKVQAEGETLPMEWPLLQQFAGREQELATLGVSDVRKLAEKVYALTLAPGEKR